MVIAKFIIENDLSGSSEKLLKYFDLFFEEISSYTDFNDHWILKSQNKKITSNDFKSLAENLRKEISDSAVNGTINGDLQSNLKENSVLSANIETIQSDLEDGDSLEFSDSIIVDGDQIIITFSDPACWLEDYENGGQIKISAGDKSELWKEGIEEDIFFLTQIKDNDGGYSDDVSNILGLD